MILLFLLQRQDAKAAQGTSHNASVELSASESSSRTDIDSQDKSPTSTELPRYSFALTSDRGAVSGGKLEEKLKSCARRIVYALLPEKSIVEQSNELILLDNNTAEVYGRAVIVANMQKSETVINYQVKVHFLPDGSCEADYPVFTPLEN